MLQAPSNTFPEPETPRPASPLSHSGSQRIETGEEIALLPLTSQQESNVKDPAAAIPYPITIEEPLSEKNRWKESLDDDSSVLILDYARNPTGVYEWSSYHVNSILNLVVSDTTSENMSSPSTMNQGPAIRLILLEGLSKGAIVGLEALQLDIPSDFYRHHLEEYPDSRIRTGVDSCLFAKWSRPVLQGFEQWDICTRISAGTPYDTKWLTDPELLQLEHKRYQLWPKIYRPYDSLEAHIDFPSGFSAAPIPEGHIRYAARESISFFHKSTDSNFTGGYIFYAHAKVLFSD